jgi:hypothetical protein
MARRCSRGCRPIRCSAGRVVVVALGVTYLSGVLRPRQRAPIAELLGLDDLARVLPWADQTPPPRGELGQVAGEIDKPK